MSGIIFWDGIISDADLQLAAGKIGVNASALLQDDKTVSGYTGADYDSNAFCVVSFDGVRLPGVCEVKGLTKCNVKNKKAHGSKGNKPTVGGYQPSEFDVQCKFWTPNHWEIVQDEIDRLWNGPMAKPVTVKGKIDPAQFTHAIYHPFLEALKITSCVIVQVSIPRAGPEPGTVIWELKCTENRDPGKQNQTATPKPGQVKRHPNFDGPQTQNSSQLPPPSSNPANMSLTPPLFTPAGGTS